MLNRIVVGIFFLCVVLPSCPTVCVGEEEAPDIEPKAAEILRQMSESLKAVKQFTFHADASVDQVMDTGQKLMYTATIDVAVRRPDRFHVDLDGERRDLSFWYDGKNLTLLGKKLNYYAVAQVPGETDAALDHMANRLGFTPPLSDMLISDPYPAMTAAVDFGYYVGLTEIFGVRCHHLAFVQENIDWQIWIEDTKRMMPKMVVITYKQVESSPQYTAVLSDWNLSARLKDELFTFVAPEGADQIEFLTLETQPFPEENK